MFGVLKPEPVNKLRTQCEAKLQEAMLAQRGGDIRRFAELSAAPSLAHRGR